ncbi:MAG: glycosyl hydrolase family 28-related protein, partial [Dermatophilaceae bacterium]
MTAITMRHAHSPFLTLLIVGALALGLVPAAPRAEGLTPLATVSVRDFGATGNGVTNDSTAIQNAFNAGSAPRTVVFPAGTYVFSNIVVKSDTTIVFQEGAKGVTPL